nr:HAD hydrolase-like protein [Lentilactobacillus otakiensis]
MTNGLPKSRIIQYARVYDGIEDVVKKLHADPNVKTAIATSKVEAEFHRDVTKFALDQYFDQFVFFQRN